MLKQMESGNGVSFITRLGQDKITVQEFSEILSNLPQDAVLTLENNNTILNIQEIFVDKNEKEVKFSSY